MKEEQMPVSDRKKTEMSYCPCCGRSTGFRKYLKLPAFIFASSPAIYRCVDCGMGRTVPPPKLEGDPYYEENARYEELFSIKAHLYRGFARRLLGILDGIVEPKGKRLLDLGCGGGFVVEVAGEMGFDAEGVEANSAMVELCRKRGLKITRGDVSKIKDLEKASYDVIVLSSVSEHLSRPDRIISSCKTLLAPGGVLILQQALFDGLLPKVFPWGWYGWQPGEHFWHYTREALSVMFERLKFEKVRERRGSLYHPWFTTGGVKVVGGRNLAAVIARAGAATGHGDGYVAVLRRR